jgi:uncharacterized protein (DUF736 family)
MARALGFFTELDDKAFSGIFRTISITTQLSIVPIDRTNDQAPDYRVTANGVEVGDGWSRQARDSGNTYVNLNLSAPEFGHHAISCRLVKMTTPQDGHTHQILWEPRR